MKTFPKCDACLIVIVIKRHDFDSIFIEHRVATVVKPQTTLRQVLVHPEDKVEKQKKAGVVYKIPCSQCEKVYSGETGTNRDEGAYQHSPIWTQTRGSGRLQSDFARLSQ